MASPGKKSFLLRIDPELWAQLESWAAQDLRSINGQVEFILREAVRRRKTGSASLPAPPPPPPEGSPGP